MSIAQYLEPGKIEFDLVLMDEASQIRPVEALGAIARGRQVVVVGDDKQLPPTRFFDKIAGSDEASEDDEFAAGDLESVLGLCQAKGIFARMLEWHYRSRHESLIAVSNREFYDDRLFIVPSSGVEVDVGLKHQLVDGTYDRGGSSTNRVEAEAVARAVIRHARERPELTLGVGTFSVAQRDAVLDALELLRRDHPETEKCFADGGPEPFFVKNLESVQGDERDVILISIGYARDESGFFAMNFGPLNAEGGERRLNVLITRARRKCEVYSSISWGDIDLRRTQSKGAAALKTFLQYAETGGNAAEAVGRTGPDDNQRGSGGRVIRPDGLRARDLTAHAAHPPELTFAPLTPSHRCSGRNGGFPGADVLPWFGASPSITEDGPGLRNEMTRREPCVIRK